MPLYLQDAEVDKLTEDLIGLTKTSKVDAAMVDLSHEIAGRRAGLPIRERLAGALAMARGAGPFAPGEHRCETDEMWNEER